MYRTDLADRVDALVAAGERKMRALVDSSDAQRIVTVGFRTPSLTNVNTEADLRALGHGLRLTAHWPSRSANNGACATSKFSNLTFMRATVTPKSI